MEPLSTAINKSDFMTLVVVWELNDGYWEIVSVVRLRCALALASESPTTRLVFPTGVLPNGVWEGVCKKHSARTNYKKADTLVLRQEKLLALLVTSPGQSNSSLADHLGISVATARQLLKKLEVDGKVHHRPHPMQNKTRLYYAGTAPTNPSTGVTPDPRRSVRSTRSSPPLKIYFVDPRTLQEVNR